ncbi:DUF6012 family protein [Shouchella clausii]|uniref:Uncharacterized protein n=1 Tax=Shouchella clausii TaxID=79880 RepID=A0A268NXG7_SHOCL|nr:DUF6012 family protein [Shouchella clausii]PAE87760.1 hypothetical protein CHH72_16660 [Shouchella clausii]
MNKHAIIRALEALNPASIHTHSISLDQVTRRILDGAKLKRKALSKQEITKYGLNIYPKSGVRVEDLIDWLITNNDIEVDQGREKKVRITPQGVQHLMELYTDHHCAAFIAYRDQVNDLTQRRNETDFDPVHVATMFYRQWSLSQIEQLYFTSEKSIQVEMQAYHEYALSQFGLKTDDDDFLFHLAPKLFLSEEEVLENIRLDVIGVDLGPHPVILDRPYPNKGYVVAGTKIGNETFTTGFYPIIDPKGAFPDELDIQYRWTIGKNKEIVHDIHIQFEFDRGNLFSTEQSLCRSNDLPNVRLATFPKNIRRKPSNTGSLHIREEATLTSFPAHLHFAFYADKHFNKWRGKRRFIGSTHR